MRVTLIILILCLQPILVLSQDLDDFFLSKTHESGTLYHLKEIDLKAPKNLDLKVDYTYLRTQAADSVRVLFLLKSKSIRGKPTSIVFRFDKREILWSESKIQLLYVDKEKKHWTTRVELAMSETDFIELLNTGFYEVDWQMKDELFNAILPKKYGESYREFAELLKYNN